MKSLPIKPVIKIEDLEKIDIRVGTIKKVENVAGSEKLVRVFVDFGDFERKIFVGMKKERDNTEEIENRQALFVVNLEPKKMMEEESEGMLFDIGFVNGMTPVLSVPEKPVPAGVSAG